MELKRPGVPNASVRISMSGSSTLCYTSVGRGARGGSEVPTSSASTSHKKMKLTSNKNFILKYFRKKKKKKNRNKNWVEGICITHSCIPPL